MGGTGGGEESRSWDSQGGATPRKEAEKLKTTEHHLVRTNKAEGKKVLKDTIVKRHLGYGRTVNWEGA